MISRKIAPQPTATEMETLSFWRNFPYYIPYNVVAITINLVLNSLQTISNDHADANVIIHDDVIKWKHFPRY